MMGTFVDRIIYFSAPNNTANVAITLVVTPNFEVFGN